MLQRAGERISRAQGAVQLCEEPPSRSPSRVHVRFRQAWAMALACNAAAAATCHCDRPWRSMTMSQCPSPSGVEWRAGLPRAAASPIRREVEAGRQRAALQQQKSHRLALLQCSSCCCFMCEHIRVSFLELSSPQEKLELSHRHSLLPFFFCLFCLFFHPLSSLASRAISISHKNQTKPSPPSPLQHGGAADHRLFGSAGRRSKN